MTTTISETISRETHEALLERALRDSERALREQLTAKETEIAGLTSQVAELTQERDSLKEDNARINSDLDKAQIDLRSATDRVSELEEAQAEAARQAEVSQRVATRTEQAKNLKLFSDDYVADKAQSWAEMSDEAWAARVEEWKAILPAQPQGGTGDSASALTGSGGLTDEARENDTNKTPARRQVLGLS